MPMRPSDPILGRSRGTAGELMGWLDSFGLISEIGAERYLYTLEYIDELERLSNLLGLDFAIVAAQAANETGDPNRGLAFLSRKWVEDGVPAGLGVTDSADLSQPFTRGADAARAHIVHLALYVMGAQAVQSSPAGEYVELDYRWQIAIDKGMSGAAKTIADLSGRWATQADYAERICARSVAIWPNLPDARAGEGGERMPGAKVLLIAGHRNTSGGNAEEKSLTDDLARAYFQAITAAGHECSWLERDVDGDNLADAHAGGLDSVGLTALKWGRDTPGDNLVILDLHFESGGGASGCFAIVADKNGLRTYAPVPQEPGDVLANMGLDLKLGRLITRGIRDSAGIPLRAGWLLEPGIMLEKQSGVGGQGYRLATFAYTSPLYMRCARLIIEHGALDSAADRARIFADGFFESVATAAAEAITAVYGAPAIEPGEPETPGDPTYEPDPPRPVIEYPEGLDKALAGRWFGEIKQGGKTYRYSEGMPVSSTWLEMGDYSPLVAVEQFGEREYFRFAGGLILWRPNANSPIRKLGAAA